MSDSLTIERPDGFDLFDEWMLALEQSDRFRSTLDADGPPRGDDAG